MEGWEGEVRAALKSVELGVIYPLADVIFKERRAVARSWGTFQCCSLASFHPPRPGQKPLGCGRGSPKFQRDNYHLRPARLTRTTTYRNAQGHKSQRRRFQARNIKKLKLKEKKMIRCCLAFGKLNGGQNTRQREGSQNNTHTAVQMLSTKQ